MIDSGMARLGSIPIKIVNAVQKLIHQQPATDAAKFDNLVAQSAVDMKWLAPHAELGELAKKFQMAREIAYANEQILAATYKTKKAPFGASEQLMLNGELTKVSLPEKNHFDMLDKAARESYGAFCAACSKVIETNAPLKKSIEARAHQTGAKVENAYLAVASAYLRKSEEPQNTTQLAAHHDTIVKSPTRETHMQPHSKPPHSKTPHIEVPHTPHVPHGGSHGGSHGSHGSHGSKPHKR